MIQTEEANRFWETEGNDMKRISLIAVIAALAMVGCNQPKGPQTTELEVPPQRPLDELAPEAMGDFVAFAPDPAVTDRLPEIVSFEADPAAPPAPAAPRTHKVRKGDTLWALATSYLGDGQRWRDIVALNPGLKPTAIPVGTTLLIPLK